MALPNIPELLTPESVRLSPHRDYRIIRGAGEEAYLNLFTAPQGDILITAAERVNHFEALTDTLPDLGLPARMKDCLVYYACWQLLSQRLPVGQEDLKLTTRQTEAGTESQTEVLDGAQTQVQTEDKAGTQAQVRDSSTVDTKDATVTTNEDGTTTEDKTPTITGTRESTTTELKAAVQSEDTNLEQTEDKNESLTSAGTESNANYVDTQQVQHTDSTSDETQTQKNGTITQNLTITENGEYGIENKNTGAESSQTQKPGTTETVTPSGKVHEEHGETSTAIWDHATPAKQVGGSVNGWSDTTDGKKVVTTMGGSNVTTGWETGSEQGDHAAQSEQTVSERGSKQDSVAGMTGTVNEQDQQTGTTESSSGTTETGRTDQTTGSNLLLNVQEKVATANEDNVTLFSETTTQGTAEDNVTIIDKTTVEVTDEDATSTVHETTDLTTSEDNTISTTQETDNTTTTATASDKVTGMETMQTYRDRLQTAQYYKMLLDLEVKNRKMRSWVARGL